MKLSIIKPLLPLTFAILITSGCSDKPDDYRTISSEGQIAYYRFDLNVKDYSARHNHGIDSTEGVYVDGVIGKALDFDGKRDYITLDSTLNFTNGLSFSFWIKSRGFITGENNGCVISKYSMSGRRSFIISSWGYGPYVSRNEISISCFPLEYSNSIQEWVSSNTIREELSRFPFDPDLWTISAPSAIELNTWEHCVVNCTPANLEIWINGKLTCSRKREYATYYDTQLQPTVIGNIPWGGGGTNNHFNGALDELKIYARPFTVEEIEILSNPYGL